MRRWLSRLPVIVGLAFLYAPMLVLVIYSFNESRLVTVWSGFSVKWYGELLRDRQILEALEACNRLDEKLWQSLVWSDRGVDMLLTPRSRRIRSLF